MKAVVANVEAMLSPLKPLLSEATQQRIWARVKSWEQTVQQAAATAAQKPLSPLVRKSQGLPTRLDPFYFTLIDDPYDQP